MTRKIAKKSSFSVAMSKDTGCIVMVRTNGKQAIDALYPIQPARDTGGEFLRCVGNCGPLKYLINIDAHICSKCGGVSYAQRP
jgi:hypothetical protein